MVKEFNPAYIYTGRVFGEIFLAEIVFDTGVVIGYGWVHDPSHKNCCRFFEKYSLNTNSFYFPKKVKEELKYMRKRIAKEHSGVEAELRLMHAFIHQFLKDATKLDYENSEYNWYLIFDAVVAVMMIWQQKQKNEISFDANHIAHYVCFSVEKGENVIHFFITTDKKIYKNRVRLQKTVCNALAEEIQVNIESVWHF